MADDAVKTQQKQADRVQQVTNEAETKVMDAFTPFRNESLDMMQHGIRRYQEAQVELLRAGSDIVMLQMDAFGKMTAARSPEEAVSVSQDAMKAIQARMTEYMKRAGDLMSRQLKDVEQSTGGQA